jgi:hypothetical protein
MLSLDEMMMRDIHIDSFLLVYFFNTHNNPASVIIIQNRSKVLSYTVKHAHIHPMNTIKKLQAKMLLLC